MLKLGGYINIFIAIAHILCLFWADAFFAYTGVGENMQRNAAINPILPYVITILVAIAFFIFGLYGLSAADKFRKLPFLKIGVFAIAVVYMGRGVVGTVINVFVEPIFLWYHLLFSFCALGIGLLYLTGGLKKWK